MNAYDDEELARRLRAALAQEASTVKISGDGLQKIRARTAGGRVKVRFPWLQGPAVAAVTLAIGLLLGFGAGFMFAGPDETWSIGVLSFGEKTPEGTPTPTPEPSAEPSPGEPSPAETTAPPPPARSTYAAPVYWLGDSEGRLWLYREFVAVPSTGAPIRDAVTALVTGDPADPDYMNLWPDGTTVLGVNRSQGVVTVDLSARANAKHAPPDTARMALQQLFWTVTAAAQDAGLKVVLEIDGAPVSNLWESGVSGAEPVGRGKTIDVLAHVWILGPTEGATVSRTFELTGMASVFEANVSIEIRRDGELVEESFATALGAAPAWAEWSTTLTLEPGTYEIRAFEASAEDGSPRFVDTKTVTVR